MIELASGRLAKMLIEKTEPLLYHLSVGDEKIDMNALQHHTMHYLQRRSK